MTAPPTIRIPESAVREFEAVERMDWTRGLTLAELLEWINRVAARYRPREIGAQSRASEAFTPRALRHYQTLGCIDAPERVGKRVVYRFRQYVQALLVRKLIWERLPSERIATIMKDRTTADLRRLLFEGIEVGVRQTTAPFTRSGASREAWHRISVVPGLELHLRADLPRPRPEEMQDWLTRLETALRRALRGNR
jgi:DNA-binding transcriptional MerR regulator